MVRICFISDVHNKYKKLILPEADIIVCSGDMTSVGKEHEIRNFLKWYNELNYPHKIFIAGNHDIMFENEGFFARSLVPYKIHYLQDSGVELMGLNFYGTPVNKSFPRWAFHKDEDGLKKHWEAIPDNTDILITHNPPYGILDKSIDQPQRFGSTSLYYEVFTRIKPVIHVYGHIHSGHGSKFISGTHFINASNLNEQYEVEYNPILVEINENKQIKILQK